MNELLGTLTKYLHSMDFTSQQKYTTPLLKLKLKAFVKSLEICVLTFLNAFAANMETSSGDTATELIAYNPFSLAWINQFIQYDYYDKLLEFMDISVL